MDESATGQQLKARLNASRYRLGVANLFFNGEESCLGGIGIFILKALGGNDTHFSLLGAFGSLVVLLQWLAVPVLNYFRSNRKAMAFSLALGVGCSMLLAGSGLTVGGPPTLQRWMLWLFPVCSLLMGMATGMQGTIETSWIGDLVPRPLRGWFHSVKSIVSIAGMAVLSMLFGFLVDYRGSLGATTFWLYVVVALSHLLAIALIRQIPDVQPQPARVFAWRTTGNDARVNFRSPVFWGLCAFNAFWTTGRTVFGVFYSVFLLQEFNFGLLGLNSLNMVTWLLSAGTLMLAGRIADKKGNRRPLMFVSTTVGCAMLVMLLT
ncbi:MAG: MFS transporter, partial [Victivallales bacterium]|nr:MFS transporter [Victivallales bacterium]